MSKSKVTFGNATGDGKTDYCTESWIFVDGQRAGLLTSRFDKTDSCDWYSNASVRCVSIEAVIWGQGDDPDLTFEVEVMKGHGYGIGGYTHYTRLTTAQSARAEVKRWVRGHFAG
jgi:hypothetical protein